MAEDRWISYLRVSTDRQGRSGLGLEGQRAAVENFLNGGRWQLVKEFVEIESGKRTACCFWADRGDNPRRFRTGNVQLRSR
jgi:hypothetical protein